MFGHVAAGATLVIPEVARELYNLTGKVPASQMQTYNETARFVFDDDKIQFRSSWRDDNLHARDWSRSVATAAVPVNASNFVVFIADVVDLGTDATR